jgi:two-component system, NtrC family, nitrogen regulation sensor histidine kinase NtrY
MDWPTNSLESLLKLGFALCMLIQVGCLSLLWPHVLWWQLSLLGLAMIGLTSWFFYELAQRVLTSFRRASVQLEALQNQDYNLLAKSTFNAGKVAEFHLQLNALGEALQEYKSHYDQQSFLLYRLIDQLNTPILVFDHRLQLSYANNAFADLFGRPWQSLRNASPTLLGLHQAPDWQFSDSAKAQQWQIRQSRFLDQGQGYQLLIFINIQTALRESQLQAWQKLIRVLSHEIRNSLTPVAALTQNLQGKAASEREQQALALIEERCKHLQDFVSRYAELHKPLQVQAQWIDAAQLFERLAGLFPAARLHVRGLPIQLWSDSVLLQQVLINLIKNAEEAGSPAGTIAIVFGAAGARQEIRVMDQGQGIANPDNLFVPFYSTKSQGQGIGLSLSRHIVEQMGGQLSLGNNPDKGACAFISLPRPQEASDSGIH